MAFCFRKIKKQTHRCVPIYLLKRICPSCLAQGFKEKLYSVYICKNVLPDIGKVFAPELPTKICSGYTMKRIVARQLSE